MTASTQLFTDRATAGADFQAKLAALKTSWITLRALDIACANARVKGLAPASAKTPLYTFGNPSVEAAILGGPLSHGEFGGNEYVSAWEAAAAAQADTHIKNAT